MNKKGYDSDYRSYTKILWEIIAKICEVCTWILISKDIASVVLGPREGDDLSGSGIANILSFQSHGFFILSIKIKIKGKKPKTTKKTKTQNQMKSYTLQRSPRINKCYVLSYPCL